MFYYLLTLKIVSYKRKKNKQFNFHQFLKSTTYYLNLINFKYYIYIYI